MNIDLVCGKEVDAQNAPSEMFEGHQFFFCSRQCREEFNRHPDRYAGEGLTSGIKYPMGITG